MLMEINFGTFIGLGLILFGLILVVGKYQYEKDTNNKD